MSNGQVDGRLDFLQYWTREHEILLGQYGVEYNLSCERR